MSESEAATQRVDGRRHTEGAPHRVLLVYGARRQVKELAQTLRSVCVEVDISEKLPDLAAARPDLMLVDYDTLPPEDRTRLVREFATLGGKTRLLLLSEDQAKADYVHLFSNRMLTNLIARNEVVDAEELIVTVQKLLRRDIFGIEKYFTWGVQPRFVRINRSSQKDAVLQDAANFSTALGIHPRLVSLFCGVADEFITNAIYNAPVDSNGNSRYAHVSREVDVSLEPGEDIEIKFSCDGRRLGISAADPFGSLTKERILDYLSKCFRKGDDQIDQKAGGAGLGFYQVFESLTQFVVNIHPGQKTEMIGLIDVRGTYKDFVSRNKSFNIFIDD